MTGKWTLSFICLEVEGFLSVALWSYYECTPEFNISNHWVYSLWSVDVLLAGKKKRLIKSALTVGFIYRFFVIILLVVTIAWVPVMETAHSEELFEYMQAVMSYLTPPIAAIFLLAVFSKRVTEQVGVCWHGHRVDSVRTRLHSRFVFARAVPRESLMLQEFTLLHHLLSERWSPPGQIWSKLPVMHAGKRRALICFLPLQGNPLSTLPVHGFAS